MGSGLGSQREENEVGLALAEGTHVCSGSKVNGGRLPRSFVREV